MSKIGLNTIFGSWGDYKRWIRVMRGMKNSTVHTFITGGTEFAKERQDVIRVIEEIGREDCLYVHRFFRPEQGNWRMSSLSPRQWQPVYRQIQPHPQIITEVPCNEPSQSEHPDFVKFQVDHLRFALDAGQNFSVGVWGVGGPQEEYIDSGGFNAIYQAVADANRGQSQRRAYISKHEYRWGWAECGAGFDDVPYRSMLSPQTLRQTMKSRTEWDIRKGRWLIRTTDWEVRHIIDNLGIDIHLVPFIFTEYGNDGVDDPINQLNHMVLWNYELTETEAETLGIDRREPHWQVTMFADRLRDKFIVPPANGLRGWGAWRRYYEKVFPNFSFQDATRLLLRHDQEDILWPDYIVGATLYIWAYHGEWGGPKNTSRHNWGEEGMDEVLMEIGSMEDKPQSIPEPDPIPVPIPPAPVEKFDEKYIRAVASNGTNIRTQPGMKGEILAKVPYEGLVAFVSQATFDDANDDFEWRKVVIGDLVGYVAYDFIDETPLTKDVTITLTWQQIKSLKNQINSL